MAGGYVHGYSEREAQRLADQAAAVGELLHYDTHFPAGSRVLEVGCGIGAQTVLLAQKGIGAQITAVDISDASIEQAMTRASAAGLSNVHFQKADLYGLPFADESFDFIFMSYVLEHLDDRPGAIAALRAKLVPGGSLIDIEGDHGTCVWRPETPASRAVWQCLIGVQQRMGGDPLIGRRLYPLLCENGFCDAVVTPRLVYGDAGRQDMRESFWRLTILPMVEGVREQALGEALVSGQEWEEGIADLARIVDDPAGTFCYAFFKAVATKN